MWWKNIIRDFSTWSQVMVPLTELLPFTFCISCQQYIRMKYIPKTSSGGWLVDRCLHLRLLSFFSSSALFPWYWVLESLRPENPCPMKKWSVPLSMEPRLFCNFCRSFLSLAVDSFILMAEMYRWFSQSKTPKYSLPKPKSSFWILCSVLWSWFHSFARTSLRVWWSLIRPSALTNHSPTNWCGSFSFHLVLTNT